MYILRNSNTPIMKRIIIEIDSKYKNEKIIINTNNIMLMWEEKLIKNIRILHFKNR